MAEVMTVAEIASRENTEWEKKPKEKMPKIQKEKKKAIHNGLIREWEKRPGKFGMKEDKRSFSFLFIDYLKINLCFSNWTLKWLGGNITMKK